MRHAKQESESIELAVLLALAGGLMDCYSYLVRDHVFANAQTGNMLLFGVNLASGDWAQCIHYAVPVVCFALGIALCHGIKLLAREEHLHWRQLALAIEVLVLVGVSFVPEGHSLFFVMRGGRVCRRLFQTAFADLAYGFPSAWRRIFYPAEGLSLSGTAPGTPVILLRNGRAAAGGSGLDRSPPAGG